MLSGFLCPPYLKVNETNSKILNFKHVYLIKNRHYIKCLNGCAKSKEEIEGHLTHKHKNGSLANKSIMGKHNNLKFYSTYYLLSSTTIETNGICYIDYTLNVLFQGRAELDARRSNSKPIG